MTVRVILALAIALACLAQAQTFRAIYTFTGGADGQNPYAGLLAYGDKVYGTALTGGEFGCGTVFEVDPKTGAETTVHTFGGGTSDGCMSYGALIRDSAGNLYGTTLTGGSGSNSGTVFRIDPSGGETVLHAFTGADGAYPTGGLVADDAGNFYGTTGGGGPALCGTVFRIDATGRLTTLYSFSGRPDGNRPLGTLVLERARLYGVTGSGGASNFGTVFELAPGSPWTETIMYSFMGEADGDDPIGGLAADGAGNLYGATFCGGNGFTGATCLAGSGVVFKLNIAARQETVLHTFGITTTDGNEPGAGVVRDSAGNLYGSTLFGGAGGFGTVFKMDSGGNLTVLHKFTGQADGGRPSFVIVTPKGRLLGEDSYGTQFNSGEIFEMVP